MGRKPEKRNGFLKHESPLHKVTDTHILATGGTLKGFFTPIPMGKILQGLNWKVQVIPYPMKKDRT